MLFIEEHIIKKKKTLHTKKLIKKNILFNTSY